MIFTVGHSTHSLEYFIGVLKSANISAIADVRSVPWSKHFPQFNRSELKSSLNDVGIEYRFFGNQLGGRPDKPSLMQNLVANYDAMAKTKEFEQGVKLVIAGAKKHRLALMCSEHDPLDCHRCLLVGKALSRLGVSVNHIQADGSITSQQDIEEQLLLMSGKISDDFFAPREELLDMAYRERSMKVAYRERVPDKPDEWELSDVRHS